jgi:hypothetical protein
VAQIEILNPTSAKPGRLTIDVVINFLRRSYHISRLTHSSKGLYEVARTYESPGCPIDMHSSYHPSGEMHCKLTRGKLFLYPGGQVLGQAQPHTNAKGVLLWQRKGQPWQSLKGVEKFGQYSKGVQSFTSIRALATGYPVYCDMDTDYVFEIDAESLLPDMIAIEYYLVEPGNIAALEGAIKEPTDSWHIPHELLILERAQLFTTLSPWCAIVLVAKETNN